MLGTTTVSIHVIVISTSSDWVTTTPVGCLQVSIIATFDMINEVVFIRRQQCSILWLPNGIFYGAKCGCKYYVFLLLV
jgi:hypothetical protein